MNTSILSEIRTQLRDNTEDERRTSMLRFFKDGDETKIYGVKTPVVRKIGRSFKKELKELSKSEVFTLCEELWKSGYIEEKIIACIFSESRKKEYEPSDFRIFERWVHTYVDNWADCDTLCNHTIGEFVMMYPMFISELKKWTASDKRFVKRAAAVTLIIPARKGQFLNDIFEIADRLLTNSEDLVQKGYGWMLKSASQAHQQKVFDYVMSRKSLMPRTALRYAIEKMPKELREQAMRRN
ncbi:MAG TPA: DNA alkylation repair protein [Balneolaceae bacterium]|nr:DNA alkylation repair protein [Balneolaceae bacterium]|tara:strand:+ start:217896 stop:218615 length:720 start_codon:yes stop_codon:yes gene_type:complete